MTEQLIYFHGLPGGAGELALFGDGMASTYAQVHVLDRSCGLSPKGQDTYFAHLAAAIQAQYPGTALRLIGFSLGASAALRTAPYLGSQVASIDIISAAAPLGLGAYLDGMAGAPVFRLARSNPFLFQQLVRIQSVAAKIAPSRLYDALFASAQGEDCLLRADPAFKAAMLLVLQQSLGQGLNTYRREIALYVQDWASELDQVTKPVIIFHGRADNWSPVAMAQDLARRLPQVEAVHLFDGLSHYSVLREYLRSYFTHPSPIVS